VEHKLDATNQILGRLATQVAKLLMGKASAKYNPKDAGEVKVMVTNTDKLAFTGKKMDQKLYRHHSGFHGGLKEKKLEVLFKKDSREVLRRAVWGMLPKNKLRVRRMKNLTLYK
jgi:large subunit ribosomal protein L13